MSEQVARAQRRELRRAIGAETADMVIAQRAKLEDYIEPGLKVIERTLPQHTDRLDRHEQLISNILERLTEQDEQMSILAGAGAKLIENSKLESETMDHLHSRLGLLSARWQMSWWRRWLWVMIGL